MALTEHRAVPRPVGTLPRCRPGQSLQLAADLPGGKGESRRGRRGTLRGTPVTGEGDVPMSHLEKVVAEALVALEGGSAGEIARPELVGAICVGEEVVRLQGPAGKARLHPSVCPSVRPTRTPGCPLAPCGLTRRGWRGAAPRGSRTAWSRGRGRGCRWLAGKAVEGVRRGRGEVTRSGDRPGRRRRRRGHTHTGGDPTHAGVDVGDELVHVLEPQVGVLVVEVGAHRHDDVVGAVALSLGRGGGWGTHRSAPPSQGGSQCPGPPTRPREQPPHRPGTPTWLAAICRKVETMPSTLFSSLSSSTTGGSEQSWSQQNPDGGL